MSRHFVTIECSTRPDSTSCPIHLRYSDAPGTFTLVDIAAGGGDCHLVQVQPSRDGRSMEIHFSGCPRMLTELRHALDIRDIEEESNLLSPLSCEYRQAGLFFGLMPEFLSENVLKRRLRDSGWPVELVCS